jgi:chitinase
MHPNRVIPPPPLNVMSDGRDDIETCQSLGKIVMLSLGGSVGTYGFSSAAQAETFATTLWDMFAEGWGSTRPFGWSLVDGFDLGTFLL